METLVLALIPVSAGIAIYAEESDPRRATLVYLFKPLTTILILALAAGLATYADAGYSGAILIGLVFSLCGDVFLMLPGDRFLAGLVSFLLAHLAYLAAFTRFVPFGAAPFAFVAVGAAEALVLRVLWPGIPRRMRIPVLGYVLVLGLMASQALTQAVVLSVRPAGMAAVGGLLFVFSDSALAYDRFRRRFPRARLVVLASYWIAQTLIGLSVLLPFALYPGRFQM